MSRLWDRRFGGLFVGLAIGGVLLACSAGRVAAQAGMAEALTIFDFEGKLDDWVIPDWAKDSPDDVGRVIATSAEFASHGSESLQLLADFPGEKWTGAYVEVMMYVTDWSPFGSISADVFVPPSAPQGLQGRIILTVGDKWTWTEMNRAIPLIPGEWTSVTANLMPGSLDWKFFPSEAFRKDVRKVGVRIESDKRPVYSGPVYIDNIRLSPSS
jgi:hypothetical protein